MKNLNPKKPKVKFVGEDGNVFSILARCGNALKKVGMEEEAKEMSEKVFKCHSYQDALSVMMEYVEAR